jgi:hypothetical protein
MPENEAYVKCGRKHTWTPPCAIPDRTDPSWLTLPEQTCIAHPGCANAMYSGTRSSAHARA